MSSRIRSLAAGAAVFTLAMAGLAASGAAQARSDVAWSIGLSAPGAAVVVGNGPRYYAPQPVYVQPAPVYVPPQPVYYGAQPVYVQPHPVYVQAPPVYVQPRPVYVQPRPVWVGPRWHHGARYPGYWR